MRLSRQIFSYLMIAGGGILLFSGAREFIQSHGAQTEMAHDFGAVIRPEPIAAGTRQPRPATRPPLGSAIGKLTIPRLGAQLYVVEGDGEKQLRRGPGHLASTALPGANGNCVIAGHRDTHFRVLKDIHKGDLIHLETRDGRFTYRVDSTTVVSPDNVSSLRPTADPRLHLVTCYPFYYVGPAPKRFVVDAGLVGPQPAAGAETTAASVTEPRFTYLAPLPSRKHTPRKSAVPAPQQPETPLILPASKPKAHRRIFGWTRVLKSFTASRSSHPTSLP